jgi:nicotinamide-nucleotide amidase
LARGIETIEHATVRDNRAATAAAIRRLAGAAPLVIVTGGLGPTADDLTRHALADALGEHLVTDPDALAALERRFTARGRPLNERQKVQAQRPPSAALLPNGNGTAPGLHAAVRSPGPHAAADVFCLPGPPAELQAMFDRSVAPLLRPDPASAIRTQLLHFIGIGEGDAAALLGPILARDREPLVGITVSDGILTLRIVARGPAKRAERAVADTAADIRRILGRHLLSETEAGEPLIAGAVLAALESRRRTLAAVESCTGGLLGELITTVPGASAVFLGGWVTYANQLKESLVGVASELLAIHGAVSEPVARAMALGGLARSSADHCLAITGIAGPEGATPGKPVGTVFIAHAWRDRDDPSEGRAVTSEVRRFLIGGTRDDVRRRAARTALAMLLFSLRPPQDRPRTLLWQVPLDGVPGT